jgi:hypothetical protein
MPAWASPAEEKAMRSFLVVLRLLMPLVVLLASCDSEFRARGFVMRAPGFANQ